MTSTRGFLLLLLGLAAAGVGGLLVLRQRASTPRITALRPNPEGVITWQLGIESAPVEVWEGSDYQCPDCARYELDVMPDIRKRFIETGKVRWRYLLFALPNHLEAGPATHAFACAREQGEPEAEAMHRGLFETQSKWARSAEHLRVFRRIAAAGGLDSSAFDACMTSGRHNSSVARSWDEAQRVGIPGTPTLLLYGRFYVGGLTANQLERVLDRPPEQ